mmetsp:Transcript_79216/g.224249  ORF Transcript_79216/g.224249 Transcript_79216/m.224249 type:complete len:212 (-) Transcript_79216:45-680(-)
MGTPRFAEALSATSFSSGPSSRPFPFASAFPNSLCLMAWSCAFRKGTLSWSVKTSSSISFMLSFPFPSASAFFRSSLNFLSLMWNRCFNCCVAGSRFVLSMHRVMSCHNSTLVNLPSESLSASLKNSAYLLGVSLNLVVILSWTRASSLSPPMTPFWSSSAHLNRCVIPNCFITLWPAPCSASSCSRSSSLVTSCHCHSCTAGGARECVTP